MFGLEEKLLFPDWNTIYGENSVADDDDEYSWVWCNHR